MKHNLMGMEKYKSYIKLCQSKEEFFKIKGNHRNKESEYKSAHVLMEIPNNAKQQPTYELFKNSLNTTAESKIQLIDLMRFKKRKNNRKTSDDLKTYRRQSSKRSISLIHSHLTLQPQNHAGFVDKTSLNDFKLIEKIGNGTYSQVYKAIHKTTKSIYALKILSKERMKRLNVEQNVLKEIKIQNYLNHPNLVELYGYFDDQQNVYLICQYCTDGNCYNFINSNKHRQHITNQQLCQTSKIIDDLCSAVNAMHDNNIMHRDIKPQNILFTIGQNVKLCDFGWATYNPQKSLRKTFCGTPLYLAPQLVKQIEYTDTVDVWAIGILTFELLTGQLPFHIREIRELQKIVKQEANYEMIGNDSAKQFVKIALEKQGQRRATIQQLMQHKFVKFHRQNIL